MGANNAKLLAAELQPIKCNFHQCIDEVDIAGCSSNSGVKKSYFEQNAISNSVGDSSKLLLMTKKELHMSFRLATGLMTFSDLELLYVRIFVEFYGISHVWQATTTKRMKIDPYRMNVLLKSMFLALICRRFLCSGPSYMHCCHVLALALARLSCEICFFLC